MEVGEGTAARKRLAGPALAAAAALLCLAAPAPAAGPVAVLEISGVIDPVLARYVERGFGEAEKIGAQCVILEINTPGGLETSMREINAVILNSPLPSVAFVSPKGARAASAGAFIVLACNFAAMSPNTTIGAASPVGAQGKDIPKTLEKKVSNDMAAYIRSLAARHGRNVQWAEDAVRKAVSVNEAEAVKQDIVDFVVENMDELLAKLDGRTVKMDGKRKALSLRGAELRRVAMGSRERFFHVIAHPEIAYILLMLGTVGLVFEFQSPGFGVSGLLGVICLVLGMISLSILPFSVGGLLIILLGLGLMIAEIKFATHGVLTLSGVACLLLGSIMLFSPLEPFWKVSRTLIVSMVVMVGSFFLMLAWLGLKAQQRPKATGKEIIPGAVGEATTSLNPNGIVHIMGEDWSATVAPGVSPMRRGTRIRVLSVDGLRLIVGPEDASSKRREQ